MKRILIMGATSAIAEATARRWAQSGHALHLVGRDESRLRAMAADLAIRGAGIVSSSTLDANDLPRHEEVLKEGMRALGGLDIVLVAHGTLGDQRACELDFSEARRQFDTNAISVMSFVTHAANLLEAQGSGAIVVLSSVAGDRGRSSNYVYGAAKAAVTTFLQGLRQRLHRNGVAVITVKPGFVDTPMTARVAKNPLFSSPDTVAKIICGAEARRRNVVYAPGFWWLIMRAITAIPEALFKRVSL